MKTNWQTKKLSEVCNFIRGPFGGSLKKNIFVKDGYAVYEQAHAIYNQFKKIRYYIDKEKFIEMKRFELKPGSLIMSCSGTMGKVAIVPNGIKKGIINQALLQLNPNDILLNTYLKLWMESESFQDSLNLYSLGSAIQNVASVKILKEIKVPLPSFSEQQRIVAILDKAFAAIAKAKENTEKNLKNARELFESYLKAIFRNSNYDWEIKKLGELCEIIMGQSPDGKTYNTKGEGIPLINGPVEFGPEPFSKTIKSKYTTKPTKYCNVGDLILCVRGSTTGRTNISGFTSCIGRGVAAIRYPENQLWVNYFILSAREDIYKLGTGSTFPNISSASLFNLKIPFPPVSKQISIISKFNALSNETKKLETIYQKKLIYLEELKKSILQKAFSGELTDMDANIDV